MPRCAGGTSFIRTPSMLKSPPVIRSNPAIIRKSVDFPQPEGPTNTINSPVLMSRLMSFNTLTSP